MRVVQINSVPYGSTGNIMRYLHDEYLAEGHQAWMMWGRGRDPETADEWKFGTTFGFCTDVGLSLIDGRAGFHSRSATKRLLKKLDSINPDLVHLHNIHGYYLNIELLFEWLVERGCEVRWTLHDCWAFTGHCAYFTYAKCDQWKTCCASESTCPQKGEYPKSLLFDNSKRNFDEKHRIFTLLPVDRLTIITPSQWLANLVGQSFLSKYPIEVRRNEIDRTVFKPTPSDFRQQYGIGDRFMVLGVASPWSKRKGLSDFIRLAKELDDSYAVVLVGLSRRQIRRVSGDVVALSRTRTKEQLAEIYTAADLLFNPTREDNYPTVLLEAQACGTPVITYDIGGCRETLSCFDSSCVDGYDEAMTMISLLRCRRGNRC